MLNMEYGSKNPIIGVLEQSKENNGIGDNYLNI